MPPKLIKPSELLTFGDVDPDQLDDRLLLVDDELETSRRLDLGH